MELKKLNKQLLLAMKNKDFEKIKVLHSDIKNFKKKLDDDYWISMKPFNDIYDIPHLPIPLTKFHVSKLIECGAIPKKDLIPGHKYLGRFRVTNYAIWNGDVFEYENDNLGQKYIDKCNHFEDDDYHALFVPLKEIEK